jgi:hypothetical protein
MFVSPGLSMPTIGHRIQVDAVIAAMVFESEMLMQTQISDMKKSAPLWGAPGLRMRCDLL